MKRKVFSVVFTCFVIFPGLSFASDTYDISGIWEIDYNVFPYSVAQTVRCVDCDTGEVCRESNWVYNLPEYSMNLTCNVSQEGGQLLGDCPGTEYSLSGSVTGNSVVFTLTMLVDQYLEGYPCTPSPVEHVFTGISDGGTINGAMTGGLYLECLDPNGCQPDDGRGRRCGPSICTSYSDSEWNGTFTVNIPPPVAKISVLPPDGRMVWFDGSGSYDPDGGEIQRYIWDFGGGSIHEGERIGIWYTETGLYTIKLTVVDDEGQTGSTEKQLPIFILDDRLWTLPIHYTKGDVKKMQYGVARLWAVSYVFGDVLPMLGWFSTMRALGAALQGHNVLDDLILDQISSHRARMLSWEADTLEEVVYALGKLADDPPDSNYREIKEIEPFETFPPEGETSMEVAIIELINCMAENQAIVNTLTTSIERFQGAVIANENEYILLQARAISDYSDMITDNLGSLDECFDRLILEIQAIQSDTDVLSDLAALQYRLAIQGFSEKEIRYFENDIGASDSEIEAYKQMLLTFGIADFRYQIEALQETFEASISSFADLSRQALDFTDGLCMATVPNILNMTETAAEAALNAIGLVKGTVTHDRSDTVPPGQVMGQTAGSGTSVSCGSSVNLVISTGPTIYVDGVTGDDSQGTGTQTSPYKTVQKALEVASNGDKIIILAGSYPENLTMNKAVTIEAQGGLVTVGQ